MIKMLLLALWASGIAIIASSAASSWQTSRTAALNVEGADKAFEYRKTRIMNVPVVNDGALQGYVIVQFLYAIDAKAAASLNGGADPFLMDGAFRILYGDPNLDFRHLDKYDMAHLTNTLKAMLDDKLGAGLIKEVLLQDFSYMPKE